MLNMRGRIIGGKIIFAHRTTHREWIVAERRQPFRHPQSAVTVYLKLRRDADT